MWGLWGQVVNDWESYSKKKNTYLKELVRKGVPHHFRGIVWQLLCGANDSPIRKQYPEYIKATSACEKVFIQFVNNLHYIRSINYNLGFRL